MFITFDTSVYSAFNRGVTRLRKWFKSDKDILIPSIVIGELRAGFAAGGRRKENESLLQRFLDSPNVTVATISDNVTKTYAEIFKGLRIKGKPIGTNDMWIAAIAIENDSDLLTLDNGFANIKGLNLARLL